MKRHFPKLALSLLTLFLFSGLISEKIKACDRSSFTLLSCTYNAGTDRWSVNTRLCIGGGVGTPNGADGPTGYCFFISMVWDDTTSTYIPSATTPASVAGGTIPSVNYYATGSLGPLFGGSGYPDDDNEGFCTDDVVNLPDFECISTVGACGNPHSTCFDIHMEFDHERPDSLRAMGIEGGWPFGGCFPNSDMLIDLTIMPMVWAGVHGTPVNGGVDLEWTTYKEKNVSHYEVFRSSNMKEFEIIGRIDAQASANLVRNYKYFDPNPSEGKNYYFLKSVDTDGGNSDESETVTVTYAPPTELSITSVYPVPATDTATVTIFSPEEENSEISVTDIQGKVICKTDKALVSGVTSVDLNLSNAGAGLYLVQVRCGGRNVVARLIKN